MRRVEMRGQALDVLAQTYYRILIINLTTDTHIDLQVAEKDELASIGYAPKISDWLTGVANAGQVHPADKRKYLQFTDIHNLQDYFRTGKTYACFNYRRKVNDEFRWVTMEFMPTEEYTDDNQVLLLSIKDVHDSFVVEMTEKDMITGGCNRRGFLRQAREILAKSDDTQSFALIHFNISGFKAINEFFGTEGGDEVLHNVYQHIFSSFLQPFLVGRMHGDHFSCLADANVIDYEKLAAMCKTSHTRGGKTIGIDILCGVYLIDDKSISVSTMCDYARLAKNNIVDQYLQPYAVFDKSMRRDYILQMEVRGRALEALEKEEFTVYYQPVFDAKTEELVSAEALIRWKYPEFGMLSPGIFIPALEESGHISKVDYFVINKVQQLLADRSSQKKPIVPISVNLSWMDFYDEKMMGAIIENVRNTEDMKLLPRFEITETSYAASHEREEDMIMSLHEAGGKLLLDDFGSGYSSFSTIRDYSFDIAKIDMGFVRQIGESNNVKSILHSLIDMFHHMDIKVIAEGVENEMQLEFLRNHGCDYIQGYYFSKPLPQEEFEQLLDKAGR